MVTASTEPSTPAGAATSGGDDFRNRLYHSYASTHAGHADRAAATLIFQRDFRPHLAAIGRGGRVLDIGCGQGELVRLLELEGFTAHGIDISPHNGHIYVVDGVTAQCFEFDPITFAELNANVLSPAPGDKVVDVAFRVDLRPTPTVVGSWGRIKSMYR